MRSRCVLRRFVVFMRSYSVSYKKRISPGIWKLAMTVTDKAGNQRTTYGKIYVAWPPPG